MTPNPTGSDFRQAAANPHLENALCQYPMI